MFEHSTQTLPWLAVKVRPNFEKTVSAQFQARGIDGFLPLYSSRRQWNDRVKTLELPLFPGYVFCRIDPRHRVPVLQVPGVTGFIAFGKTLAPIPDEEIHAVKMIIQSKLQASPCPFLRVGQTVLINKGPLAGIEGILTEFRNNYRIVVSVPMLQRSVSADIDSAWVTPVGAAHRLN
jgi:transcription antitermination factor NusG